MKTKFSQDVIKELNKFRADPKSIQHQCDLIQKGFSRLRANDPFLKEIESFIGELERMKPLPELRYNEVLSEAARKELPNFRGKANYQKYRTGKSLKGIVPDSYLEAFPSLVADDGADEPVNVLTKTLLNKLDKFKEGRAILCDPKLTQVGIAHEVFEDENMVILIFASKFIDPKGIKSTKKDFLFNIQYHEHRDIKKPKYEVYVYHKIRGEIFGDNFDKTRFEKVVYSQGGNRPKLELKTNYTGKEHVRTNKSVRTMPDYSSRTAVPKKPTRNPLTGTAKNVKMQKSTMRRRNDGTVQSSITTQTKTTTTSTNYRNPNQKYSSTTSRVVNRSTGRRPGSGLSSGETVKKTQQMYKTKTTNLPKRGRAGSDVTKISRKFKVGNDDLNKKNKIISITRVEESGDKKLGDDFTKIKKFKRGSGDTSSNKEETKYLSISITKVEEEKVKGGEVSTVSKTTKKISSGGTGAGTKETTVVTKVEGKGDDKAAGGPSIRRKYARKKRF